MRQVAATTKASLGMRIKGRNTRKFLVKSAELKHFEHVGVDTNRPPCAGIELFTYTARFHYFSGG